MLHKHFYIAKIEQNLYAAGGCTLIPAPITIVPNLEIAFEESSGQRHKWLHTVDYIS